MYVLRFVFLSIFLFFVQISINGAITTGSFTSGNPFQIFPTLADSSIYPFFFDANTETPACGANCGIFHRTNPSQETLDNITKLVNKKYEFDEKPGFTPLMEETSVITWSKIPQYRDGPGVGKTHIKNRLFSSFYFESFVKAK